MKVKDVLKMLKDDGWYESRQKGSHQLSDEIKRGTLGSILKPAQIKEH